jgi:hypothetical protein
VSLRSSLFTGWLLLLPLTAGAHHGVATLGVAGLDGPGAPLETSSTATLPAGGWLVSVKIDHADFETFTPARDDESAVSTYTLFGLGYGLTPWCSFYAFQPHNTKTSENNAGNTAGFADLSLLAVVGLRWDGALRLVPADESLDDMEDLHLTLFLGSTLPTGDAELAAPDGTLDPGRALGFGTRATSLGLSLTRPLSPRWTGVLEASLIRFGTHVYDDGAAVRFGTEQRLNLASVVRVLTRHASRTRLDLNLEANALVLGRDALDGVGETATGGRVLYGTCGLRLTRGATSLGLGWKTPVWKDLNEEAAQQGAEGVETGRFIATVSSLF